jgi:hypothetical protein
MQTEPRDQDWCKQSGVSQLYLNPCVWVKANISSYPSNEYPPPKDTDQLPILSIHGHWAAGVIDYPLADGETGTFIITCEYKLVSGNGRSTTAVTSSDAYMRGQPLMLQPCLIPVSRSRYPIVALWFRR